MNHQGPRTAEPGLVPELAGKLSGPDSGAFENNSITLVGTRGLFGLVGFQGSSDRVKMMI